MDTSWPPWVPSPGGSSPQRSTRSRSKSPAGTSRGKDPEELKHQQELRKLELERHEADKEAKRLKDMSVKMTSDHQRNKNLIKTGAVTSTPITLTGDWNEVWDGTGENEIVGRLSLWQDGDIVHGTHEAAEGAGPPEICTVKGRLHDEIVTWLFIDWETEFTGTLSRDLTVLSGICRKKIDSDEWSIRFVRKTSMKKAVTATVKSPPRSPRLAGVKSRYRDTAQQKVPIGRTATPPSVRAGSPSKRQVKISTVASKPIVRSGSQKLKSVLRESSTGPKRAVSTTPTTTSTRVKSTAAFGRTTSPIKRTASPSRPSSRTSSPAPRLARTSSPGASQYRSSLQQSATSRIASTQRTSQQQQQQQLPSQNVRVVNVNDGSTSGGGSNSMPIFTSAGGTQSAQRDASASVVSSAIATNTNRTSSPGRKGGRSGTPRDRIASGSPAASTISRLSGVQTRATTSAIPTELEENEVLQLQYLRAAVTTKRLRQSKKQQFEQVTKQHRMLSALTANLNSEASEKELENETALRKGSIAGSIREFDVPARSQRVLSDAAVIHQKIADAVANRSTSMELNQLSVSSLRSLHDSLQTAKELLSTVSSVSSDTSQSLIETLSHIDHMSTNSAQHLALLFDFINGRSPFHKLLSLRADLQQRRYVSSFCKDP
eukprot:TRINITY_DN16110_c0_g1_i1.p1 TRINITY_DN16110_c0_g1~~TRINITY_DN16110_c0_g1_i1.p1  ORF type:complete len:681 (+),score=128.20 TRINITY_DN16110_c0_g1_i1:67-2043(+)